MSAQYSIFLSLTLTRFIQKSTMAGRLLLYAHAVIDFFVVGQNISGNCIDGLGVFAQLLSVKLQASIMSHGFVGNPSSVDNVAFSS